MRDTSESMLLIEEINLTQYLVEREHAFDNGKSLVLHVMELMNRCIELFPDFQNRMPCHRLVMEGEYVGFINYWNGIQERMISDLEYARVYVRFQIGNPVANRLLNDALLEAGVALDQEHYQCAAIMTRVAVESTMKEMCLKRGIDISSIKTAGRIVQVLHDQKVIDTSLMHELNSKLSILNPAAHEKKGPGLSQIRAVITWTQIFIATNLGGENTTPGSVGTLELE